MKVLVLTHAYPRFPSDAAGNFVFRLVEALGTEGVTSHVVAPGSPGYAAREVVEGVVVQRFRYAPRKYETLAYTGNMAQDVSASWHARFALAGLLGADFRAAVHARREFQPDIIHAHWWFPSGLVGKWVTSLSGVPLVVTSHGSDIRLARTHNIGRNLGRHVFQHAAAVTTVSHWLAQGVREIAPQCAPIVAPMPVDTTRFIPPDGPRDGKRLLFVGRLNAQKGIAHAIHALARMADADVTLDVVGEGRQRKHYTEMAQSLGVGARITFHGHLPPDVLVKFYQRASALVMPSLDEGLGLTAVEAHLCELPVVAFESGGLPDIVRHEQTGMLVPPEQLEPLVSALDRIIANPVWAADLGRAGRLTALANFAPASVASRYLGIYEDVLRAKPER